MKHKTLAFLTVIACLQCACSRSKPDDTSPQSIKSQFPEQFARIEYYAQNFTKIINSVPFPPEGAEEKDKQLFQIPSILNLSVQNESTHMVISPESWSRQPLNNRSFMLQPNDETLPRVAIGKGSAGGAETFDIVEYTDVVVESATGNKIRFTIDFDLAELKKHAEQGAGSKGK